MRKLRDDAHERHTSEDGCYVHPHCLTCPLPACIYDIDYDRQRKMIRNDLIRWFYERGVTPTHIAEAFQMSRRGIHYIIG